jgi:hypothetical protein
MIKVQDYSNLRRADAGIINVSSDEYFRAKQRARERDRLGKLEEGYVRMSSKMEMLDTKFDRIIGLLESALNTQLT